MSTYDPLSFFDTDVETPAPAASTAPAAETPTLEPVAAPVAETPAVAAPAAEKPEFEGAPAGFVPIGALTAERQRRQTLEEQVNAAKVPANGTPPAAAQPAAPVVIPQVGTPEHAAYLQDQLVQTQVTSQFNLSESRFVAAHGAEATQKLQEWADKQDVFFFQRLLASPDPYAMAKKEFDREVAADAYTAIPQDQFAAFQKFLADQAAAAAGGVVTPTATSAQPAVIAPSALAAQQKALQPTASSGTIVTNPSASGVKPGETPAAPGNAFATIFE